MPDLHPVSRSRHARQYWRPCPDYAFARGFSTLPLGLEELSRAVPTLAVAFVRQEAAFQVVALLSLKPDCNHYVTPDAQWPHGHVPAVLRTYPFRLLDGPDGAPLVCVDEASGLVSPDASGQPFFDAQGEPAPALQEMLAALHRNDRSLKAAAAACAQLQLHGLIKPWPIRIRQAAGEQKLAGLFQVDEAALNRVPAPVLGELRDSGALLLAYSQLLSMQHLRFLGELAEAHAQAEQAKKAAQPAPATGALDLEFLKQDGLSFNGFR